MICRGTIQTDRLAGWFNSVVVTRAKSLANRHKAVACCSKARHDLRQHLDRGEFAAVKQDDLGSGRVMLQVLSQVSGRDRAPVTAVVGPQNRLIAQGLSDLDRLDRIPAVRGPEKIENRGIVHEWVQRGSTAQDLGAYLAGRLLIEVRMGVRMVGDFISRALDTLRQLRPLHRVASDQKERRVHVEA